MHKKVLIGLVLAGLGTLVFFFFSSSQKNTPATQNSLPADTTQAQNTPAQTCKAVTVLSPKVNQQIVTPLKVQIIVDNRNTDCHWTVFEGQAGTMEIKDRNGKVLGSGFLSTTENWMTREPVTFTGTITFTIPPNNSGLTLIISEENPSGSADANVISIPLK